MLRDYTPLPSTMLDSGAGYAQPTQAIPDRVGLDDPAQHVMTDFRSVAAVIILSGDTVEEAHRRMIQRGVRLLLVVDQDRRVVGVVTATDILGEKPMQVIAHRGIRREELLVRDIMRCETREHKLYALGHNDGTWARARDPQWKFISAREMPPHYVMLFRDFMCPSRYLLPEPRTVVAALKRGEPISPTTQNRGD